MTKAQLAGDAVPGLLEILHFAYQEKIPLALIGRYEKFCQFPDRKKFEKALTHSKGTSIFSIIDSPKILESVEEYLKKLQLAFKTQLITFEQKIDLPALRVDIKRLDRLVNEIESQIRDLMQTTMEPFMGEDYLEQKSRLTQQVKRIFIDKGIL